MALKLKENSRPNAVFRFKFSPLFLTLCCVGLALAVAGIALNSWRFITFLSEGDLKSYYDWITFLLFYFVCFFFVVLVVAMLVKSQYVLTERELISQFGIIRSKYEIKKITSVCLFRSTNKLTVYFDDFKTKFIVIVVKEEWYHDFIKALTERNEKIGFDFISPEQEEKENKKNGKNDKNDKDDKQ